MEGLAVAPARFQIPFADTPYALWRGVDGEVAATFHHRANGEFVIRFLERADFVIAMHGAGVTCTPVPDFPERLTRDLYLNQVMPLIRAHEGALVVHASAAAVNGVAILFVAQSGRGKSTLAAAFARAGFPFLSDDGVTLTRTEAGYLAQPNRPSFRLWSDSRHAIGEALDIDDDEAKTRVEANEALPFHAEPLPVQALYFLGPGDAGAARIEAISSRQTVAELMNHTFLLDAADRRRLNDHFEMLAVLAETVLSFAFDYPRDYARLDETIAALVGHVARGELVQ